MSAMSGVKTVTAAGTAEALGSGQLGNAGYIYVGNDGAGDVASTNGLELAAGDVAIFDHVSNLSAIMVDSSVNGEGVSWIMLSI
jgi:hypothetical protein